MRESVRLLLMRIRWEGGGVVGGRVTGRFRRSGGVGIVGMIGGSRARVWVWVV